MNKLLEAITSPDETLRNQPFLALCRAMSANRLIEACEELERFRHASENLYEQVRATLFLYAAYRFLLLESPDIPALGQISPEGHALLLGRQFEQAITLFRRDMRKQGPNSALLSALAECYHQLAFQTLLSQVRRSVRSSRGNQWMFRVGHTQDHPISIRPELLRRPEGSLLFPVLMEATSVRLDLSHSGWSDIFFLGMDYPEGARVMNISVDLGVYGRDDATRPPVESYIRVIPEPVLRLTSIDLKATKDVTDLADLFNFGNDYLSLLKAGVIASGLIPPSFEGTGQPLGQLLERIAGRGMGIELVTRVNDIPKGSRLAVSTNLLASIIAVIMRATGQTRALEGGLEEDERRLCASRAILGEWLGGSGGGWQDSGGIWPGIKVIHGDLAKEGDPEYGISRGCLLPRHRVLGAGELHPEITERLTRSLVLFHGGMAQNVGPILEMVTEKYLLRGEREWQGRLAMREIFDGMLAALKAGDVRELAALTTRNWNGPLKTIIPWVTNRFTETIIARAGERLGKDFWGFLMLGGMSGGGMAMFVAPERHAAFKDELLEILRREKALLEDALPFAMDPVVYDFKINGRGSWATLLQGGEAVMPPAYYGLQVPEMVRQAPEAVSYLRRAELDHFTLQCTQGQESYRMLRTIVSNLFRVSDPASQEGRLAWLAEAERIKQQFGFDRIQHEQLREDLRSGRLGLSRNRLPVSTAIEDVREGDVMMLDDPGGAQRRAGEQALAEGRVAVLTLAGGMGSRWTTGAGVVKALNPFVFMAGRHRSFLEIHFAKTRRVSQACGAAVPHLVSTSFLTHEPTRRHMERSGNFGYEGPVILSPGRSIAQRLVPMVRDLVFLWEETPQEMLDENKQKVREAVRRALIQWAQSVGEGSDYTDNVPVQHFSPPGHWYEVPNLFQNGALARLLRERPQVRTLLVHNVDTLGASLDPAVLGRHLASGDIVTFEVTARRAGDRGGGLARVGGRLRLLEGLAQPREEDELRLSYYNSNTAWIEIDPFLGAFGLTREDILDYEARREKIAEAIRRMAARIPTYVTIKNVKRRWGHGQEDVYPVAQFEKLWGDVTSLSDIACGFLAVGRLRGQQLKDLNELDPWANDGSRDHVEGLCLF